MREKMRFGGGVFAPPQGYYPQNHTDIGFGFSGPQGLVIPSFWVPFSDLGSGVVDTTEIRTNATPTFTRATTAWTRLSTGLWASVASGSARSYYDASGNYRGFLCEGARTNNALQSRDLSNAAWTKSSTTGAKTQTGIDGAANSCSLLTATGANGTCLQSITEGSASKTFSAWVKRSVGTGTINITIDGGTTWVDVTSQINSSTFSLVQVNQTVTNQSIGFRIVTSGDAIIVDMCQEETGAFASSPYPAVAAAVTRNGDVLTYPITNVSMTSGSAYIEVVHTPSAWGVSGGYIASSTSSAGRFLYAGSSTGISCFDGTNNITGTTATKSADVLVKVASSWGSNILVTGSGNSPTSGSFDGDMSGTGAISVGMFNGANPAFAALRNGKIFNRQISSSQLQAMTV